MVISLRSALAGPVILVNKTAVFRLKDFKAPDAHWEISVLLKHLWILLKGLLYFNRCNRFCLICKTPLNPAL